MTTSFYFNSLCAEGSGHNRMLASRSLVVPALLTVHHIISTTPRAAVRIEPKVRDGTWSGYEEGNLTTTPRSDDTI